MPAKLGEEAGEVGSRRELLQDDRSFVVCGLPFHRPNRPNPHAPDAVRASGPCLDFHENARPPAPVLQRSTDGVIREPGRSLVACRGAFSMVRGARRLTDSCLM